MNHKETDLHLHLDGSLSLQAVEELANRNGISLDGVNLHDTLSVGEDCNSLVEYLNCFELPGRLLQTAEALEYASCDLAKRLGDQGLLYAEIRFAPQLHKKKGLSQEQAVEAVTRGVKRGCESSGLKAGVLLCAMVGGEDLENEETIGLAKGYSGRGVVGADIAGAEGRVPMKHYKSLFGHAYRQEVPFTIHAGECGSYEHVAMAVSFGARRIGHGCASIHSEEVMELLIREKITLEMCVVSNLQTKAVPSIEAHPLKVFYDRGIHVTYNTDNMTVSHTSLAREARLLTEVMGFSEADLVQMNRYAIQAAFVPENEKIVLLTKLDKK